jgi:hypothetical protein
VRFYFEVLECEPSEFILKMSTWSLFQDAELVAVNFGLCMIHSEAPLTAVQLQAIEFEESLYEESRPISLSALATLASSVDMWFQDMELLVFRSTRQIELSAEYSEVLQAADMSIRVEDGCYWIFNAIDEGLLEDVRTIVLEIFPGKKIWMDDGLNQN